MYLLTSQQAATVLSQSAYNYTQPPKKNNILFV